MEKLTFEQLPEAITLLLKKVDNLEKLLSGESATSLIAAKQMLKTEEAASFLSISLSKLYKMSAKRELPLYKPGGKKVYFKREDLLEWLSTNRCMSNHEIEKEAINYITNGKRKAYRFK